MQFRQIGIPSQLIRDNYFCRPVASSENVTVILRLLIVVKHQCVKGGAMKDHRGGDTPVACFRAALDRRTGA